MVKLIGWVIEEGIELKSLRESIDLSTPTGNMLAGIFASRAEYKRALMIERAGSAREAARARGKQVCRPMSISPDKLKKARDLLDAGWSRVAVADDLKVSRASLYREIPAN